MTHCDIDNLIHDEALRLGFSACGYASVEDVDARVYTHWQRWIEQGKHADMQYMERHSDIRRNPQGLLPQARTIISVALNYSPPEMLPREHPQFARYAYGEDYHTIMRDLLQQLVQFIQSLSPCDCRICCDTAPIFERYWATKAGIGFIGRNSQLIIPHQGSYFFIGEILTTLTLTPSTPLNINCGSCRRCIDACPMSAIADDGSIDARRCISCQTIENRGELPKTVTEQLGRRIYGCDTCQEVCPHNRHTQPTAIKRLFPLPQLKELSYDRLKNLSKEEFDTIFRHSAVKRAKYAGLMRNWSALNPELFE